MFNQPVFTCSAEKKAWVVNELNPILEEVVADTIKATPDDPVAFMLYLMEKMKAAQEDACLMPEEWVRLTQENEGLKKTVNKLRAQSQHVVAMAVEETFDEKASNASEDSSLSEPPEGFQEIDENDPAPAVAKHRTSVAAESVINEKEHENFIPPVHAKSQEQKERLRAILLKSFMFSNLEEGDMDVVVNAMEDVQVQVGERIIKQGDNGNVLFIVESGKLDCLVDNKDAEKVVKTVQSGDVVGELALLYNCPRAASVQAVEKSLLWQLDRKTFSAIVKVAAQNKRRRYEKFLAKVPLLEKMSDYEKSQLADALKMEIIEADTDIIKEGEIGDKFYILESGEAVARKKGVDVMQYSSGHYFGELALLTKNPRAATIRTTTTCKLLSLGAAPFRRLLNTKELVERSRTYS